MENGGVGIDSDVPGEGVVDDVVVGLGWDWEVGCGVGVRLAIRGESHRGRKNIDVLSHIEGVKERAVVYGDGVVCAGNDADLGK